MAQRNNGEARCQSMFFDWLAVGHPSVRKLTFAIPNGGCRDAREGKSLKNQGVTRGVFDVFISIPKNGFHGLYIEFKFGRNKLTTEQAQFKELVTNAGYLAEVCYSFEEAINITNAYVREQNE